MATVNGGAGQDFIHRAGDGAVHDASDRVIYNSATGAASYDPDGTGASAAIQFAKLSAGLALTNADFVIV